MKRSLDIEKKKRVPTSAFCLLGMVEAVSPSLIVTSFQVVLLQPSIFFPIFWAQPTLAP
jgi:hypothetical protein